MRKKSVSVILVLLLVCFLALTCFACNDRREDLSKESPIQNILITTMPKTNYYVGDKFSVGDAYITVYFENGDLKRVPLTLNMISGFDSNIVGEQILTVFYENKTAYLTVNVSVAPVYSIQVCQMPEKTGYVIGEELDVKGMQILVTYSNNYTDILDVTEDMVSMFSTEYEGETEMIIEYAGKTCKATYNVVKKRIDKVETSLADNFRLVYVVGDAFELTGGRFFVHYNDNTSEYLDWNTLYESGKLSFVIDKESGNVFTASALERSVYLYYNAERFQIGVTVSAKRPQEISVMSDAPDQVLKGHTDLTGGQLYVVYNSKQTGYTARVKDSTAEARRAYADGKWNAVRSEYFVLSGGVYSTAGTYSTDVTYYSSLENDFVDRYETRKEYLYVKNGSAFEKAPADYDASIVYYVPSNVRLFDFDDAMNVEIVWNDFDINVVNEYSIRLIVDNVSVDYCIKVVAPSPIALEVYPVATDVNTDPDTGAYYVFQDETIHVTDWEYKIKQNNDTYSIISSTGTYSANVTQEMYVGNTFMTNHLVGTYTYDFSFTTVSGVTLDCSVPVEVRQRVIVSATVADPTRSVYSVGDSVSLAGGSMRVRYINGEEGETMPFTVDMLYTVDPTGNSDIRYTAPSGAVIPLVKADVDSFTSAAGDSTLYIYYEDGYYDTFFATEFKITVIIKAISISLNEDKSTKNDYILGETFSMENWEVLITYADYGYATENDFSDERWTIEGDDLSTVGTHTITLYYGDKSDNISLTYVCTVHNNITAVQASRDFIGCTTEGKSYNFGDISFVAVRENGDQEAVSLAAMTISQTKAGMFVSSPADYAVATFFDPADWATYYTALFVKDGDDYLPAPAVYDESVDYYYAVDNMAEIVFTYDGKDAVLTSLVVSRRIEQVTVLVAPTTEYVLASTGDWDMTSLSLQLTFDNGTTAVVKDASSGSTVTFVQSGDRYTFVLNNMIYYFEVKNSGNNYSLTDIKADLQAQTAEEFVEKDLSFSVSDAVYRDVVSSATVPFYCFNQRVLSVHAEIGVPTMSGSDIVGVTEYADTTVYLNEGLSLYRAEQSGGFTFFGDNGNKRFVYSSTNVKTDYLESMYLVVEYDSLTVYKKLSDIASSSGFSAEGFSASKTGSQTIRLTYLLKECSFTVYVRPNVPYAISFVDENESPVTATSVIENMPIDPNKISVSVELRDADGDPVEARRKVDFSDATCTYDKTDAVVFTEKNSDDVYYLEKMVTVSYEGCEKTLALTIYKKSVSEIVMQTMPQQVYAELPETALAEESVLVYTNSNGEMGTVLVRYNNGTSEIVPLNDSRLRINAAQFNTKLVLNAGAEQSQIITIGFTDENNVTKETSYNVIVRDRKYLTISYDSSNNLSFDNIYYCQYGTGVDARPKFDVYYYSSFYLNTPVAFNGYTVTYEYHDDTLGDVVRSIWPTEVGSYRMVISYAGDYANNPFEDRTVTIEITKKQIGISVEDITLTFGDKFDGTSEDVSSLRALGIVWSMSGVMSGNLTGDAFVLGDTIDNVVSVSFELYQNGRKLEPAFSTDRSYLVLNVNVGEYYIKPVITLKKANYTVPEGVGDVGATLTVSKKPIKIVALGEKKIYGDRDPVYRFEVYDGNNVLLGGNYYRELTGFTVGEPVDENVYVLDPATGIYVPVTGNYESGKTYYVFKAEVAVDSIFVDTSFAAYRLVRSGTDTDNVTDYHKIFNGDMQGTLDNYTLIEYIPSSLVVLPAELTVTARTASRPFGTAEMSIEYVAAANSAFRYNDNFNSVFGQYFTQSAVLYYDMTKKQVFQSLTEGLTSYDNWAVLYRNVEIDGFESVVYDGATYAVIPIALACGTYTCRMSDVYADVVANYIVTTEAFELEIVPVSVQLNVGSVLLYEKSTVKDGRTNTFIDYFTFPREDFQTTNIYGQTVTFADFVFSVDSRSDIDSLYGDWMTNLIIGAEYNTGNNAQYLLSYAYLNGFTFTKERGTDTGVYRVSIGYNYSDNFSDFSVVSYNNEKNKNYFTFYYEIFRSQFPQIGAVQSSLYDEGAYVIVLPGFTDLKYYRSDEEGARYSEVYNFCAVDSWKLNTEYSLNKVDYADLSAIGTDSVSYSIVPKEGTQFIVFNRENYLAAGNYTGSVSYSYFADVNKTNKFSTDYIYLGNSSVLLDNDIAAILNYMLFGAVTDGALVFNNTFDYTVKQKPVSVYIENKDTQYNFSNQTLVVRVDGSLAAEDRLNFLFDLDIVYNSKTDVVENNATTIKSFAYYSIVPDEMLTIDNMSSFYEYGSMGFILTQDTIPMSRKAYYIYTNASDPSNEAYDIAYSGTYTITLNDLGNNNYCLATGDAVVKTFTIVPNEIPILLYNKASTPQVSTTDFTFEETYTKKAFTPIDSTWTATSFANTLLFDSVSLTGLSSVNSSATRVIGSVTIGSDSYDVSIKFHGTFSGLTVSGRDIKTPAPNSRTLMMDTYSTENDYYFSFVDGTSAERKIYYDADTNTYYYKDAAYTTYKTTTCTIIDYYYDEDGVLHRPQALVNTPNTLYIYSEDEPGSGNRPVYVKRDPETKEVLGYDIVSRDTSAYVNYSVVFVYLDNGVYRQCDDAHRFSFVINPAEVSLYNFSSANVKEYDGSPAAITNTSKLTVNGALSTDPVSVSDIVFTFERLDEEGSTYITIGGERYYLVSEDDMRSAGVFKVSAYFSDNYNIVFKGNGSYLTSPSQYGVYTIKRVKATFEFNSESVSYLSKQYDGQGLTESGTLLYTGDLSDFIDRGYNIISKQSKTIVDSYTDIYYQLTAKGYATAFNGTPTSISQSQLASYDYSTGYYWFDFYGVFVDKNGNYHRYEDRDTTEEGVRWLNWNYSYIVNNKKDVNKIGDVYHDGIYRIDKRKAYIGINGQLPDNTVSASYTYLHQYNGVTVSRADVNTWLQTGVVTVYVYDETARKFVPVEDTYLSDAYNGGYLSVSGGRINITNVGATEFFELSVSGITENNSNFQIVNSDIRYMLKPLEIEIMLTYTNADYNNASAVTYGKTARENAVNFTLSISEEELEKFNAAINDGNTYTASQVLEMVSYFNNAEFYLYDETNSNSAVFKFLLEGKSRYLFAYDAAGDYFTQLSDGGNVDGVEYYNRLLVPNSVALDYTKYYSYHEQFELTSDAMSVAGKKYYSVEQVTENDPEFRAGNGVPENSYYERGYEYAFTVDTVFRSGVSYYLRNPGTKEYVLADTSALIGSAVPGSTYYTQTIYYVLTTDRVFDLQKRYYTFTEYTFTEQNAVATANVYYELNKFFSENEDEYFLSGRDYYVFTVVTTLEAGAGTNVKAETYYELTDGRFTLTSDLTFVRSKLVGGNYYTVAKANVIAGDNAHKKYYVQNAGRWERVPDGTARASGVNYYVFMPTVYSQEQTVTEYYYYYADGRFYNVNEMNHVMDGGNNYYVAYIAEKSANENVSYYTEYEAIVKAQGTIENGAYYYKAVLMDHTEDAGTYYAVKRLLPGKDYAYNASVSGSVYENVDGSDTYFPTTDLTYKRGKNYYVLVAVSSDLVAGDNVSGYYIVAQGYSRAEDSFENTEETYYKAVELVAGKNYAVNSLIPNNTYYVKNEGEERYSYAQSLYFSDRETYYVFEAVRGVTDSASYDDLYTYNDGRYKKIVALVAGKDYVNSSLIGADVVYYESGDRFVRETGLKYRKNVNYYRFVTADGYISNRALGDYYVDSSSDYTLREMTAGLDYVIGDSIGENVVLADSFAFTTDTTYMPGKLYYTYDNDGYVSGAMTGKYSVPAEGFYSAKELTGFTVGTLAPQGVYAQRGDRFVSAAGTLYQAGGRYYTFTVQSGFIAMADLDDYYVAGAGYYSATLMVKDSDYAVNAPVAANVYRLVNGRMIAVSSTENYADGVTYYSLSDSGFIKYSDRNDYYVNGTGYYSRRQLTVGVDYNVGDGIGSGIYVYKYGRYILPEELTFRSGTTYYAMDNIGLVFGGDISSYCVTGEKYYSFSLLTPVENDPIEGDVYTIESGMFMLSTDTVYHGGKDYYLRTNEGIVDPSDLSGYYVDATGYYTLVEQAAGVSYAIGANIPDNMYYEVCADGICRFTRDERFISGKKYYLFRADNTYLPADADLSAYYFESNSEYGVILLIAGKDYENGTVVGTNVYTVDDKWYSCVTSGVYEVNKRYLVFEAAEGYIRYDRVNATFVKSGATRYSVKIATGYVVGATIPAGYYVLTSDGRLISASGTFEEGKTYYVVENNGFIYAADENDLFVSDDRYYSFIEKDVTSLIGASASGSYIKEGDGRMVAASGTYLSGATYYEIVNSGLVQIGLLGEYYVSGAGRYSVKRTSYSSSAYVYLKNNEYVKTTDASAQEGTEYFTFTTGGYVKSKYYSQYFVPSDVFRTDLVTYNYYRYGNDVPYAIENGADNYYYNTVPGRVFEKSGDSYFLTEDKLFIVGKDYYLFVPVTDFSARETADGLFVFRRGYIRTRESYAALRKADVGIDYQVGSFVSGKFFTVNESGVPFEVPSGSVFSADTTYYCMIDYYGITEIPTYYELQASGAYAVTTDRTFNTEKTYYTFSQESVVVGNLIPQGYYFVKNGAEFVLPEEETFLENVTYYTVRTANVSNNAYVVKGLYEKAGDVYVVTADTIMDGNKKYYRFAKDSSVEYSDPVLLYEKVGTEYVLTGDARTSTGTTYYYFKQSPYSFSYFTGAGAPYYSGIADLSSLESGVYYTGANNFTSSANFSLKIVSSPFEVERQVIHVTGVEREYYDREKSNWKFILADDTETNAEIMNILYSSRTGFIQQLEDKSSIAEAAGSYYTRSSGNYYMTLNKTAINEFNNAEGNNYYIVFDGVSVSGESSDNVCIPLYIKRVPIVVSMTIPGTVEYGVKPEKSELISSLRYSSYPDVSTDQSAAREQREFFNFIEGNEVIDFDAIIRAISTTDYNAGLSTSLSLLYNLKMNLNAINASGFENYTVSFGEIVYTIAQRRINIQINSNRNYYDANSAVEGVNFSGTPFTVLYSDVNNLFYDDASRDYRSYSLKIDTFSSGENVYSVDNLSEQIIEIVNGVEFIRYVVYDANNNNAIVATGETVQQLCAALGYSAQYADGMTISQLMEIVNEDHIAYRLREVIRYKNVQYDSIQALLNVMTQYVIEDENGNADYMAGVNYIRLYDEIKWYDSNNYILVSAKTPIIVYPEIDSVGEYDDGKEVDKKYINLIGDTEAVFSGRVSVNNITKEISNLSFIMRLNMRGMKTQTLDYSTQYVDSLAFSSEYEMYYYVGNRYTREMHVYYVSGGTEAVDGSVTLKIGDVITVTVTVTENFNNFAALPAINSMQFKIRLVEKMIVNDDDTTVSVLPLADTTDTVLYNGSLSSGKVLTYGKAVQNSSGEYVLYNPSQDGTAGVDVRKESYDMLSMRVRLTPATGSNTYSFTSTLYENSVGKLVFVITGGTDRRCFIRYYYNEDYYSLNTHTVAQSGVTYYRLTQIDSTSVTESNIGDYYMERGGLLYRAYGSPDTSKNYYTLAPASISAGSSIATPSAYAVKFSEDALSAESLGDIFDGRSHRLTFYLDRSGYLYDLITHSSVERTVTTTDRFVKNNGDAFDSSRTYFTADLTHLTSDVFILDSDYFVMKDGYLVKPDHAYAKENVDYYWVQLDSSVTAGTLTSNHYYAEDIAQESLFIYCPTSYDALKKYYVYLSVDGDAAYSSASSEASKVILSFTGGLYKCETEYSKTIGDNTIIEGDSRNTVLQDVYFYVSPDGQQVAGASGISYSNVQPLISYYAMKKKLAQTISYSETIYLRNITMFPEQFYDNSSAYLVTKATAETVSEMVERVKQSILYYATYGSADNTASLYNPSLLASTKVSIGSPSYEVYNGDKSDMTALNVSAKNLSYGMFVMKLPVIFNYLDSNHTYQTILEYKLLITDNATETQTVFYEYALNESERTMVRASETAYIPSSSNPTVMTAGSTSKYFFNNTPIEKYDSSTYIFDLSFTAETSKANLYLGLSDKELHDLENNMLKDGYDLWRASGIGITIQKSAGMVTTTVYGSVYTPCRFISVPLESYFEANETYYTLVDGAYTLFTEYQVGAMVTSDVYVIDREDKDGCSNIYCSKPYTDIDWEYGRNILKVDYIKADDEALVSIRLYQYYYDSASGQYVTDFVWQEYFRAAFYQSKRIAPPISSEYVKQLVDNVRYVGFGLTSTSIKLYNQTMTTCDTADYDLTKNSYASTGFKYYVDDINNLANESLDYEGIYEYGHDSIVHNQSIWGSSGGFLGTSGGSYYALTDAYGVPSAYTGNTTSISFSMSGSDVFFWYLASSTPYLVSNEALSYLRQRGLAIVSNGDGYLYFEFYKYNKEYVYQPLNLPLAEGFNIADGKVHTITVSIGEFCSAFDEREHDAILRQKQKPYDPLDDPFTAIKIAKEQLGVARDGESEPRGFYFVRIYVDGVLTTCVCPYSNDLGGVTDRRKSSGADAEIGDYSTVVDTHFLQGIYYTGIRFEGSMTITDYSTYDKR